MPLMLPPMPMPTTDMVDTMAEDMADTTAEDMADTVDTMVDTVANDLLMPMPLLTPMPTTDMEVMVDTVMVDTEDIMVEMFSHMIKSLEFKKTNNLAPFYVQKTKDYICIFCIRKTVELPIK